MDIVNEVTNTHRELGNTPVAAGAGRSLLLRRRYGAPAEDVWNALTDKVRLQRWLGEVEGDLRAGGSFELKGNASGEILGCQEPRLLKVTWAAMPGMVTEVEVRLAPGEDGGTVLELDHSSPAEIIDELVRSHGPGGTIGVGCGWDLTLLALDLHLRGREFNPATWEDLPEAQEFAVRACHAWGDVVRDAWGTSDEDVAAAVDFAVAHFAPGAGGGG